MGTGRNRTGTSRIVRHTAGRSPWGSPTMTKDWTSVRVTGMASVIVPGTILLPKGTAPISPIVVEASNKTTKFLPGGVRADTGTDAALPGDLLTKMGGDESAIKYRKGTWADILHYKPAVRLQI